MIGLEDRTPGERTLELAQEGFHYDDTIRWKTAEDVLPERMVGATFFSNVYGNMNVTNDGLILIQPAKDRNFDPNKEYLYPIPG
jgi:hypothetical protein